MTCLTIYTWTAGEPKGGAVAVPSFVPKQHWCQKEARRAIHICGKSPKMPNFMTKMRSRPKIAHSRPYWVLIFVNAGERFCAELLIL